MFDFKYFCKVTNNHSMKSKSVFTTASERYVAPECEMVHLRQESAFMVGSGASSDGWDIDDGDFPLMAPSMPEFIF